MRLQTVRLYIQQQYMDTYTPHTHCHCSLGTNWIKIKRESLNILELNNSNILEIQIVCKLLWCECPYMLEKRINHDNSTTHISKSLTYIRKGTNQWITSRNEYFLLWIWNEVFVEGITNGVLITTSGTCVQMSILIHVNRLRSSQPYHT